jgi:hypothetical protein
MIHSSATTWRYKGKNVASFHDLVNSYPGAEFSSPLRSTVPLLAFWRDSDVDLSILQRDLSLVIRDRVALSFEHQVPVKAGRGKASHTDLMLSSTEWAMAIEAKYTEPPYPTTSEWLQNAQGSNRRSVLVGWLSSINTAAGCSLTTEDVASVTYQLIHRTASVCEEPLERRLVAYQCFDCGDKREGYISQLNYMASLVPRHTIEFAILECPLRKTTRFRELVERWQARKRNLAEEIREGLIAGDLLEIDAWKATLV